MKIYDINTINNTEKAVALGYFDGVHKGHQKVIIQTVEEKKFGLTPTVLTFDQNPKNILYNNHVKQLTNLSTKQKIFKKLNIEILYIINFKEICNLSPEEFIKNILINKLNTKCIVCGFNYKFGKNASGDTNLLKKICSDYNIKTKIIFPVLHKNLPISSTRIRYNILNKNFEEASFMLN